MQKIKVTFLEQLPHSYFRQLQLLLRRILPLYGIYFVTRLVFFLVNRQLFSNTGTLTFIKDAIAGLRFDTFSIVISSSLFILLSSLPIHLFWKAWYQKMLKLLYFIPNAIFISFNLIDAAYYPFIKKRSTSEIFQQMGGQSDLTRLIPQFLADYWYLLVLWIVLLLALLFWYSAIRLKKTSSMSKNRPVINWLVFLLIVALCTIGARGGLQRVPIDVVHAGGMAAPEEIPIVLNSPFTIIKSFGQKTIPPLSYFDNTELSKHYSCKHQYNYAQMRKQNVVVLILESFSKEYTALGKVNSLTPFLDSLLQQSLVFTNAYSNGTKSIEGIPAILSSMPSMMPNPVINSVYANVKQTSLANILADEGYQTAFFHGGINGTMNFDDWSKFVGYQQYYGQNEYNNKADFDGYWGIWDEPFLQFTVKKMNELHQPFHSAVFTLSSHHPYFIPEKYKGKFKSTPLENSASIGYADYALRKFFETAKQQSWYNSTLFVLTADHTGISEHPFFSNPIGLSSIPIAFFAPADSSLKGEIAEPFSQIDILPSVLNYLQYPKPFFAFGSAYNEAQKGFVYMNAGVVTHNMTDSLAYIFIDGECQSVYNFMRDSTLQQNLKNRYPELEKTQTTKFRAFMQTYEQTLNGNGASLEK